MAAISAIIAAVGVAASIGGTVASVMGANKQADAQEKAEKLRKTQADLESARQRRDIARKAMAARAEALNNAASQGAQNGSGLQGGYGQIQGQAGNSMVASNENQQIGGQMFQANAAAASGAQMASFGSGLGSLGGTLIGNSEMFGRVGSYLTGRG